MAAPVTSLAATLAFTAAVAAAVDRRARHVADAPRLPASPAEADAAPSAAPATQKPHRSRTRTRRVPAATAEAL